MRTQISLFSFLLSFKPLGVEGERVFTLKFPSLCFRMDRFSKMERPKDPKEVCRFCGHKKGLPAPPRDPGIGDPCRCSCHH
jgi:hypothetical protein